MSLYTAKQVAEMARLYSEANVLVREIKIFREQTDEFGPWEAADISEELEDKIREYREKVPFEVRQKLPIRMPPRIEREII
jgi:hypothetical protein